MSTISKLKTYLNIQHTRVRDGVEVVDTKTLTYPLLHISTNHNIKEFIPSVTRRTAKNEDRSMPRVSVAPSLLGCFIGYVIGWDAFYWPEQKGKKLLQDWVVYGFETPYALKPNVKLLYDQKLSDEHWLVGYSQDTQVYKPVKLAKGFYKEARLIARPNMTPLAIVTILIHVYDEPILFAEGIVLTKGYWKIEGPEPLYAKNWKESKLYKVAQTNRNEFSFHTLRNNQIATEDFELPSYMGW